MEDILHIGDQTYRVLRLLGKGKGGYSYLVTDGAQKFVLKQIHHEPCSYYTFGDKLASELHDYETLHALGIPMPKLLAVDPVSERILKEYIDGDTVFDYVRDDRMRPDFFAQIEKMCDILYPAGLNIDYFPTNFVVQDGILYYIDYECNQYMSEWDLANWGIRYWSKTPEFLRYLSEHS